MTKLTLRILYIILALFLIPTTTTATEWELSETENFRIYYPKSYRALANHALTTLELYRPMVMDYTQNESLEKFTIVLEDHGLISNGYANPLKPKVSLWQSPPNSNGFISQYEDWVRLLSVHELTHIAHMTNKSEIITMFTWLFGNILGPNIFSPGWLAEGIAVNIESDLTPYEGRLNQGYSEAIIAAKAKAGKLPKQLGLLDNPFHQYPYASSRYVYGSHFIDHIDQKEKIGNFISNNSKSLAALLSVVAPGAGIDAKAKETYGESFPQLYKNWQNNLSATYRNWSIPGIQLTQTGDFKRFLTQYRDKLYYTHTQVQHPNPLNNKRVTNIIAYNPNNRKKVTIESLQAPVTQPLKFHNNHIYYTVLDLEHGFDNQISLSFGGTHILYKQNLTTGKRVKLLKGQIRSFTILKDGTILYTKFARDHVNTEIWSIKHSRRTKLGTTNLQISEWAHSQDNLYIVAKKANKSWDIYRLDLDTLETTNMTETPWAETQITYQAPYLYYTGNYNKKTYIYRLNTLDATTQKLISKGYANYSTAFNDNLYFISINETGEDLYVHNIKASPVDIGQYQKTKQNPITYTPINSTKGNVLKENSKSIVPYVRAWPFLYFLGSDDLDYLFYQFQVLNNGVYTTIGTTLFKPGILTATWLSEENESLVQLLFPLYTSIQKGITDVSVGLIKNIDDQPVAFARSTYQRPLVKTDVSYGININDVKENFLTFSQNLTLDKHTFTYSLHTTSGIEILNPFHPEISDTETTLEEDGVASISWTHKLFSINNGFRNPLISFGSVFGNLFTEYGTISKSSQLTGYELQIETSFFRGLSGIIKTGAASTNKNDTYVFASLSLGL